MIIASQFLNSESYIRNWSQEELSENLGGTIPLSLNVDFHVNISDFDNVQIEKGF